MENQRKIHKNHLLFFIFSVSRLERVHRSINIHFSFVSVLCIYAVGIIDNIRAYETQQTYIQI